MDAVSDVGKLFVGGVIAFVVWWLLIGVLVDLPGHLVLSLFSAKEKDPDNLTDIDPTGRKSRIVGVILWVVVLAAGYAIYGVTK